LRAKNLSRKGAKGDKAVNNIAYGVSVIKDIF